MDAVSKVFTALLPARAGEPLSDWEKGKLILEHFNIEKVSEELMLEALITLLLSAHAPADEFESFVPRISGLIDELVGTHIHTDVDCLQDVRSWLEEGATLPYVRARTEAQRTVST